MRRNTSKRIAEELQLDGEQTGMLLAIAIRRGGGNENIDPVLAQRRKFYRTPARACRRAAGAVPGGVMGGPSIPTHDIGQPEPIRRPDTLTPRRWPWWQVATAWIAVAALCGLAVVGERANRERWAQTTAARQQQHEVQLRACLDGKGVPYFTEAGLFRWCQVPEAR